MRKSEQPTMSGDQMSQFWRAVERPTMNESRMLIAKTSVPTKGRGR